MDVQVQELIVKHMLVSVAGRVDAFSIPALQAQLDTFLAGNIKHFIIDLTQINFMDSSGLAVLIKLLKHVNQVKGTIVLVMPRDEAARRIFRLTHFDHIFETVDTVEEVVQRL